ncbi:oligosaccharide flippase family protein [Paenibacillus yanchengensis]|uniref:Oligosaccharide flippase family protein n=1 Tax=Paenibacillus yanchengensis TaxID=2035833 RepID=A0ABW4YHL0_9BACL
MAKKESLIKGTLILVVATLLVRILSIGQRIPLEHMFGDIGNAAYGLATNVYLMLLTVASAGIPSTLSKMVSERYALNKPHEVHRIFRAALIFSAISGVVMTVFLYLVAPFYAEHIAKVPEASLAIRALAPALLLFPATAMIRGYFQGRGNMTAPAISQIVEQILRVVTAIGLAFMMLHMGYSDQWLAAGASFGGVLGSIGAFGAMLYYLVKRKKEDRSAPLAASLYEESTIPYKKIYTDIFKLSVPIVLTSLAVTAVNFIDGSIVKLLLSGKIGEVLAEQSLAYLTSRAQMIAGIPPILAIALSTSLIPVISAAFTRNDVSHLRSQVTLAMRISILTSMPIVIALSTTAYSVNGLLFKSLDGSSIVGLLTLMTIFQVTMMTSNSILLSIGKPNYSMIHVGIGIVAKIIGSYVLSYLWGIYGIITATGLCFFIITILNLRMIKKIVPFSIMGKRWVGFLVTVIVLSGIGYSLNQAGIQMVSVFADRIAFFLTCCIVGAVVATLYPVLLIVLRVIRQDDLKGFPTPLRKIISPLMKLQRG